MSKTVLRFATTLVATAAVVVGVSVGAMAKDNATVAAADTAVSVLDLSDLGLDVSDLLGDVAVGDIAAGNVSAALENMLNDASVLNGTSVDLVDDVTAANDLLNGNQLVTDALKNNNIDIHDVVGIGHIGTGNLLLVAR